jgi:hypothetical protein
MMQHFLTSYINSKLTEAIISVSNILRISLPSDQLYEELVPYDVQLATHDLAGLIQPVALGTVKPVNGIEMHIYLESTSAYPCFFTPVHGFRILPESKIRSQFDLLAQTAVEWANLRYVVSQFSMLPPRAFSMLMPWARDLALDHDAFKDKEDKDDHQQMVERAALKGLIAGRATTFPAITPAVNAICKSGVQLFAQYKLSQDAIPEYKHDSYILINPESVSVSTQLMQEVQVIIDNYHDRLALRRAQGSEE